MKKLGYNLVKLWIKASLYLYHGKIEVHGLENIPKDKPVLFLPNHQSALLDVLLIAVDCRRKPYFLTRSDIFKSKFLNAVFEFFQMIPIYRIRDGRESLKNNQEVFERCAALLESKEALLMFPEANHNLRRRVRPLSKGFTRILFAALEKNPDLDIQMVPVGLNYRNATEFPDRVALHYGKCIALQDLIFEDDNRRSTQQIKDAVAEALKGLTTHVEPESEYESIIAQLDARHVDYLNPGQVNKVISQLDKKEPKPQGVSKPSFIRSILKGLFTILNLPMVMLWRLFIKPKVWEPEFMGTLRFTFGLIGYPLYYILLFILLTIFGNWVMALLVIGGLILFNVVYVKSA